MNSQLLELLQSLFLYTLASILVGNVNSFQPRLIGGRYPGSHIPYLVAVQIGPVVACGGAIIDDKFILTAAHCLYADKPTGRLPQVARVIAAINDTRYYDAKRAIIVNVARAFIPKNIQIPYRIGEYIGDGDIAVLELEKSLDLKNNQDKLEKLELPERIYKTPTVIYLTYCWLVKFAGFGISHFDLISPIDDTSFHTFEDLATNVTLGPLQEADAIIIDNNICRNKFPNLYKYVTDSHICAKIIEDNTYTRPQGACYGDSGSPLVFSNTYVIGVSSFISDDECNTNVSPAVFTRVSSYTEFIKNAMKGGKRNVTVIPR